MFHRNMFIVNKSISIRERLVKNKSLFTFHYNILPKKIPLTFVNGVLPCCVPQVKYNFDFSVKKNKIYVV